MLKSRIQWAAARHIVQIARRPQTDFEPDRRSVAAEGDRALNELRETLKTAIRAQVEALKARADDFYGYALMANGDRQVESLIAVWNRESEIKQDTVYYRFCPEEWPNWEYDGLPTVNQSLARINQKMASSGEPDWSEAEIAHRQSVHTTIRGALGELAAEGLFNFGQHRIFVVVWESDSDPESVIIPSVHAANPPELVEQFMRESW